MNYRGDDYKCSKCGAAKCKLWRLYSDSSETPDLYCAECAAADQHADISTLDALGLIRTQFGLVDSIGWLVPAVPTAGGSAFYGYLPTTPESRAWWEALPSRQRIPLEPTEIDLALVDTDTE